MAPQTASHAAIELASFRERVIGIDGAMLATADGLCVASVALSVQPESMAALGAASLGVAWRIAAEGGIEGLQEVRVHGNTGFISVHPVGPNTLMVVIGDNGTDRFALQRELPQTLARLASLLER
ncbi:roadblock/LC7 domain-containing protein [Streptomyces sp. NBC_01210]|uniref:roadblock/LC7 domain-containing protein n=1 Tax=Streptomyces sp. NBC_01210 TaxID=2903774 RepID=UPI002E14D558|nr:roadblock/LC7 domain-containing protein [Streptomyces sp. NBC_01210]